MVYCRNCGEKLDDEKNYCGKCGTPKIREISKKTENPNNFSRKNTSNSGSTLLICFCLIAGYLALNFWAIGQIEIDDSASSIINSISNTNFQTGILKTELGTKLRIKNPTIIPVLVSEVSYDLSYGDNVMGQGTTGFIFIMPKSHLDTPINFELNHVDTGTAIVEGIINIFQKEKKSLRMNFYAGFGPAKIPVGELK
ncbi:MAG: zinc-ribbon domain-containing protein [Candidatus Aenigmarchaeota archaeon]|nr:zinc-ribbon domain-containing protein [Candidatus Aenigmarchaeota archaeon]